MTITPADETALNADVLNQFTYTMPQSYGHGGNGTTVDWYEQQLGSFAKIVYGLSSEGFINGDPSPDDPQDYVRDAKKNGASGVFSWRLDTDTMTGSLSAQGLPMCPPDKDVTGSAIYRCHWVGRAAGGRGAPA
jgi:hypothetical protein